MANDPSIRTPLGRARGLGSAHDGSHHWWVQRMTAVALIPLLTWLAVSVALLSQQPFDIVRNWMASPITAVLLLLTIFNMFYHAWLGLQVIVEDYIAKKATRLALLILIQGAIWLGCAASLFAVIKIALG